MHMQRIAVQVSREHQTGLELDLHTRFDIQVNDVFPATHADEKVLTFVISSKQMGICEQLVAHLESQKTAGIIRAVEIIPWQENEDVDSEYEEDEEREEPERSLGEELACAESALETLSESWVQNVFGDDATDVVFDALHLFLESRRQQQEIVPDKVNIRRFDDDFTTTWLIEQSIRLHLKVQARNVEGASDQLPPIGAIERVLRPLFEAAGCEVDDLFYDESQQEIEATEKDHASPLFEA